MPHTVRSPEIAAYQSNLLGLSTRVFHSDADISLCFDEFLAQALLINMY